MSIEPVRQEPAFGEPYIICENLVKIYQVADIEVFAFKALIWSYAGES